MDFHWAPIWPWWLTAPLAAGLFGFAAYSYPAGVPRRRTLLALRAVSIFAALFAACRPSLEFQKKIRQSSTLVLLHDQSRSMALKDMWRNLSRWEALKELRKDADADLKELAETVKVREFAFDRKLHETDGAALPAAAEGKQTALGDALEELVGRLGDDRVAGVLVLSDGVTNAGVDPAEIRRGLASRGIPVHAFGFGSDTATEAVRDLAALKIVTNPVAFKKNRLPVRAEFATAGFGGRNVPATLSFDGVQQGTGLLKSAEGAQKGEVEIVGVPTRAGDVKVTLDVAVQPGELLANNNSISTYVTVRSDGLQALYVEGKYRFWESRFVRRALDRSPDIDCAQRYLLGDFGKTQDLDDDLFKPGGADVVILGDVPANRIPASQLEKLAALLKNGTGLLMTGGYESFGPGGWDNTPIAPYLPVVMRPADQQSEADFQFQPTDAGLRHFVLRLANDPKENDDIWKALKPLDGATLWSGLQPNALVLAETPAKQPVLVAGEIGKCRSLAFACDTSWRWATQSARGAAHHAKFWRQAILWLAHREDEAGKEIRLRLDRRRVLLGEKLPIEAAFATPDGKPPAGIELRAVVRREGQPDVPVALVRQGNSYRGTVGGLDQADDYTVAVVGTTGGEQYGSASAKFLVYDEDLELRQLPADLDSLRKLAADTGGEYRPAEEFPKFVKELKAKDLNQETLKPVVENLWDRWEPLALFVAALVLEWTLRKMNGMV